MLRQIVHVPKLFGDHSTLIGKILHRRDEWFWIATGSEFVMAAFAGQDRPAATDASSVISAAVIFLPVAIVIVTAPTGTLRQIMF